MRLPMKMRVKLLKLMLFINSCKKSSSIGILKLLLSICKVVKDGKFLIYCDISTDNLINNFVSRVIGITSPSG